MDYKILEKTEEDKVNMDMKKIKEYVALKEGIKINKIIDVIIDGDKVQCLLDVPFSHNINNSNCFLTQSYSKLYNIKDIL